MHSIDMTGWRIGKLTVIRKSYKPNPRNHAKWICRCDCGNQIIVYGDRLRAGKVTSCGCSKPKKDKYTIRSQPLDRRSKYGCEYCKELSSCNPDGECKYADIFEKYGGFEFYNQAAEEKI